MVFRNIIRLKQQNSPFTQSIEQLRRGHENRKLLMSRCSTRRPGLITSGFLVPSAMLIVLQKRDQANCKHMLSSVVSFLTMLWRRHNTPCSTWTQADFGGSPRMWFSTNERSVVDVARASSAENPPPRTITAEFFPLFESEQAEQPAVLFFWLGYCSRFVVRCADD